MLERFWRALGALTDRCYRYIAAPNAQPPYIVWAEDGANDFEAGNQHAEYALTGTVDLYTKDANEKLERTIPVTLDQLGVSWYLNSVQYEQETGLIHYEWAWEVPGGEADV